MRKCIAIALGDPNQRTNHADAVLGKGQRMANLLPSPMSVGKQSPARRKKIDSAFAIGNGHGFGCRWASSTPSATAFTVHPSVP